MNFADRIKAAIGIISGKQTADSAQIASITKERDDAVTANAKATDKITALTAQIAAIGDPAALEAAVVQLEAIAKKAGV